MTKFISIPVLALVAMLTLPANGMVISFSETEFANGSWSTVEVLDTTPNDSFTISGTQLTPGGNPGAYRQVVNQINTPTASSVIAGHFHSGFTYDPGTDGAFSSFDISFDGISDPSTAGGAMGYGLLLRQSGNYYRVNVGFAVNGLGWTSLSASGITESDFISQNGGTLDLSTGGCAIDIGIYVSNGTLGEPSINTGGFDNLSLDINVPEPGTLMVFGFGLFGLMANRRRKQLI